MVKFGASLENPVEHETLARTALELERLGYDSVWFEDHLVISMGSFYMKTHKQIPISILAPSELECWTTLSWLAARTSKIRLGTLVLCNAFRYPSVVAKMASTFDVLSNGRLEFGIGAGYWKPEFEMYGIPLPDHATRIEQLVEAVQLIKEMWTKEVASFNGKYYNVNEALNNPKPLQKPHPPITIGGRTMRSMNAAARVADNWNFPGATTLSPEEYGKLGASFDEYCHEAGRSLGEVVKSVQFADCIIDKTEDGVRDKMKQFKPEWESLDEFMKRPIGTPEQWIEKLNAFREQGVEAFIIDFPESTDLKSWRLLAQEVIPALK